MRSKQEQQKRAFKYFCHGLTSKEIGQLIGASFRTVQGYRSDGHWSELPIDHPHVLIVYQLSQYGYKGKAIADMLDISPALVSKHLARGREIFQPITNQTDQA